MSVSSAMTAIADKIRTLLGMTGTMGLDAMATNLTAANSEVSTQEDLIAQIAAALEGKAGGTSAVVRYAEYTPSSNSRSATFTGLVQEPTMLCLTPDGNISLSSNTRYVTSLYYGKDDGNYGVCSTTSTAYFTKDCFTWTYSNGTLTITTASMSSGGYFKSGTKYWLNYV